MGQVPWRQQLTNNQQPHTPLPAGCRCGAGMFEGVNIDADFPFKTVNGIAANAAMGSIWAVITTDADYNNIILAAPLEHYKPEGY